MPRESAIQISNQGFGYGKAYTPVIPFLFIPILIVAVIFILLVKRRVRAVVDGVMQSVTAEKEMGDKILVRGRESTIHEK